MTALNPVSRAEHWSVSKNSTKKVHISLRKASSHSWEVCFEKIAHFLISFVNFQFISYTSYVDFKEFHHPVFLSSGAKQVKACRSLTAVNHPKIFKVGKSRNNSIFFNFSEKCENLKKLRRFLNLTFS